MGKIHKVGIIGCGDFLRLECNNINNSKNICVKSIFDTDNMRAGKYAKILGGNVVNTDDYIFDDSEIDIVCIFVPPWARRNLVIKAAKFKKHILTTKPLGLNIIDCLAMVKKVVGEKSKMWSYIWTYGNH